MAKRDDPIDDLFKLPLTEFIGARKELATRLKKSGYTDESATVNALAKPPVSAWAVNQLYWNHREEFDELIATGQRLRKAQTSGKMANMREALDARREALSQLSDLATELLTEAGHNPSLDTLRRITSTLEALSASTSPSDGPTPGRLTHDVDPPGFDSFGSFVPSAVTPRRAPKRQPAAPAKKTASPSKIQPTTTAADAQRREARQARINAAKTSLQSVKKTLSAAQAQAKSLAAAQTRAAAAAKEADKQKRQAEERLKKASTAAEAAEERAESIAAEAAEAADAVEEAKRSVEKATRELEASFRESAK